MQVNLKWNASAEAFRLFFIMHTSQTFAQKQFSKAVFLGLTAISMSAPVPLGQIHPNSF